MWFFYALLGAFGKSYSGFFRKKMAGNVGAATYIWVSYSILLIILTPILLMRSSQMIELVRTIPIVIIGAAVANLLATQLNLAALKHEELSYTAPLNAFVPVFTLIIAGLFLQEHPPRFGVLGILSIFLGAYVINIKPQRTAWYDPLTHLVTNRGAQLSLCVALGYAINTTLLKVISNNGYDAFTSLYATTALGWIFFAHVPFVKRKELKAAVKSNGFVLIGSGISSFFSAFFHIVAVGMTYTSYAVSVRRLEVLIAVFLGWRYLKETNIRNKLIGSLLMLVGTVVMAIS